MKKLKLSLGLALTAAAVAAAFSEPVRPGLYLDQNVQAAVNPLGLQLGSKLFHRFPLVKKEGILWESTKVDIGLKNNLSPAFDLVGAFIDIEPIAVFDLALSAQFVGYFSALGFGFRDLPGYGASFDASALDAIPDKNAAGYLLSVAPTLKFALGSFVFSNTLNVNYFRVDGGSGFFYETIGNCPLSKSGFELYNDAYGLYMLDSAFMLGLNYSILGVPASGYRSQTLQAVGVYSGKLGERISLYAALTAGTYLEDRYLKYMPRVAGQAGIVLQSSP
jgi:hypothetical protein